MTVDIIIPTYKPDETLCLLLHKLQGQTFVVHRVIILNTEEKLWKQAAAAYPIEQVSCRQPWSRPSMSDAHRYRWMHSLQML